MDSYLRGRRRPAVLDEMDGDLGADGTLQAERLAVARRLLHATPTFNHALVLVGSSCIFTKAIQGDTSGGAKPPIDIKTKVPGQARQRQNGTFVSMSTGGLAQPDVSPCTCSSPMSFSTFQMKRVI